MRLISVKMPEALIEAMDELVRRGLYPNRSAIMRTAVRDLLKKELWESEVLEYSALTDEWGSE